jgi:hypothetical protein
MRQFVYACYFVFGRCAQIGMFFSLYHCKVSLVDNQGNYWVWCHGMTNSLLVRKLSWFILDPAAHSTKIGINVYEEKKEQTFDKKNCNKRNKSIKNYNPFIFLSRLKTKDPWPWVFLSESFLAYHGYMLKIPYSSWVPRNLMAMTDGVKAIRVRAEEQIGFRYSGRGNVTVLRSRCILTGLYFCKRHICCFLFLSWT